MKINEQVALMTNQTQQTNHQTNLNFEQWLTTPTKQNNGDEYYWQHQGDLEQSSVHFDSKPEKCHHQPLELFDNSGELTQTSLPVEKSSIPAQCNDNDFQIPKGDYPQLSFKESSKLFTTLEHELNSKLAPYSELNASLKSEEHTKIQETGLADTGPGSNYSFKNHHLFIQNEQVELTLNTNDLNFKEQNELKHMLKHYLKNKGLKLSTLIINGVKHD